MTRTIGESHTTTETLTVAEKDIDVRQWLEEQAQSWEKGWLLAHADDRVIWGKLWGGKLMIAPAGDYTPQLQNVTLQNARLFNKDGEIYLWRDDDGKFKARIIQESSGDKISYFDEKQFLWGDSAKSLDNGFTLMSDGSQGLCHVVPLEVQVKGNERPLGLQVRHYLEEDGTGYVRVAYSRLVDLKDENNKQGGY